MKNRIISLKMYFCLVGLLCFFSCTKKNNNQDVAISNSQEIQQTIATETKTDVNNYETQLESKIEDVKNSFSPAIEIISEYTFEPIKDDELKLLDFIINENNNIDCLYNGNLLCVVDCINEKIDRVYNQCIPSEEGWSYSAGFEISLEKNNYYGLINLGSGILKIYKSLQYQHQATPPFYSGNSKYFVIENIGIVRKSYYDTKTFKQVKEQYGGFLEVYNFETNDLVFKIDRNLLHKTMSLKIEKIEYIGDDFHIKIGNYYDSDEFVDFYLYTDNEVFSYEIKASFSYEEDF